MSFVAPAPALTGLPSSRPSRPDAYARALPGRASPAPVAARTDEVALRVPAVRGELRVRLAMRHVGPREVTLRYETQGDGARPAVFVAGGISAHRHLAASEAFREPGWWEAQVGDGRALDPRDHRLIAIDWVGADGTIDAPIDPADQAQAIAALLDHLGIARLAAFVGCSYGAMVGLQFAALHRRRVGHLIAISGTHRAHPYASAWRALQRQVVALGALQGDLQHGLSLARQLAMLSYRTPEEYDVRFGSATVAAGRVQADAEDYLAHCGQRYAATTSATAFVRLSESIDLQHVDPERIVAAATVVAVAEDRLVPLTDACVLAERLRGETRLRVLRSKYGHDAFLKEQEAIDGVLREALADSLELDAPGACA